MSIRLLCAVPHMSIIIRTYAVGAQMGGLEGRVPAGCPSKELYFPPLLGDKVAQQWQRDLRGRQAAPKPPPRKSCYNMLGCSLCIPKRACSPPNLPTNTDCVSPTWVKHDPVAGARTR